MRILSKLLDEYVHYPQGALRPVGFAARYRNLEVHAGPKGQVKVSVHKYRMNTEDPGQAEFDERGRIHDLGAKKEFHQAKESLRRWIRSIEDAGDQNEDGVLERLGALGMIPWLHPPRRLRRVYLGKGSPRDMALALGLVHASGRLAMLYPGYEPDAALQRYCDDYLGVDCSGFVNCYFTAIGRRPDDLTDRPTIAMYARERRRLAALPGSPLNHVFCWVKGESHTGVAPRQAIRFGHIVVIDEWVRPPDPTSNDPAGARFRCTQSAASLGGITTQVYEIEQGPSRGRRAHTWRIRRVDGLGDNVVNPQRVVWNDVFLAPPF